MVTARFVGKPCAIEKTLLFSFFMVLRNGHPGFCWNFSWAVSPLKFSWLTLRGVEATGDIAFQSGELPGSKIQLYKAK